mmetsp:Transcript_7425/g.14703  ORF Transcript_7425/g.14703 Transcript_7425/m.14703 type:complete len:142 (-) Transcript_7425:272-697(-)
MAKKSKTKGSKKKASSVKPSLSTCLSLGSLLMAFELDALPPNLQEAVGEEGLRSLMNLIGNALGGNSGNNDNKDDDDDDDDDDEEEEEEEEADETSRAASNFTTERRSLAHSGVREKVAGGGGGGCAPEEATAKAGEGRET